MSNDTISVTTAANIGKIAQHVPHPLSIFFTSHNRLSCPLSVITAVALDRDLAGDFNFSSANFDEIGTNIARDNVPDVVIPGGLLSDIPDNLGLPSVLGDVRIPVAFTVTRNVDQFLPRRLDNGRYSHRGAVGWLHGSYASHMFVWVSPIHLTQLHWKGIDIALPPPSLPCLTLPLPLPLPSLFALHTVNLCQTGLSRGHSPSLFKLALEMKSSTRML